MNGRTIRWQDAKVHVSAHSLHYGSGVFEGIRCYETAEGPAIFRLGPHLDRFYASAAAYGTRIPYGPGELEEAICETIRRNEFQSCYIRPICYHGSASLSVHPGKVPVEEVILTLPCAPY